MNRTRTSTLDAFGLRDQRNRIFPALSASDGSTLDLDFTTMGGALDSRFTFSRTSNATYINSSGYVAYNISNLFFNTAWTSITLPTGWEEGINTAGTFTYNGNGTITLSAVSGRAVLIPAFPRVATLIGVPFTISFTVTAVSGSPTLADVITANAGTDTFTVNGITKTSAEVLFANDLITCTSTATSTAHVPRIGIGVLGVLASTKSVTIKNPQANIGATAQPYTANASTTTAYYAPRFDYNPTTLAAKGLLIEASATNLQRHSATFETTGSYWYSTAGSMQAGVLGDAPDLGTPQLFLEPGSGTGAGQWQLSGTSAGLVASTTYTVSFWAKTESRNKVMWRCDGGGKDVGFNLDTGVATVVAGTFTTTRMTAYPNGWYRCEATWANVNAGGFPSIYTATGTGTTYTISYSCNGLFVQLSGFQLEVGAGASSYIPTVASQVTKAADECYMANISSFGYSTTNGTIATQLVYSKQATSYIEQIGFMTAGDQPTFEIFLSPSASLYTAVRGASLATGGQNEMGSTITLNTLIKYAVSVDTVTDPIVKVNTNGVAVSANKTGTGNMYTATRFVFGRLPASSYGSNYGCLTIKSVKYWNTTKTAAELAALTA